MIRKFSFAKLLLLHVTFLGWEIDPIMNLQIFTLFTYYCTLLFYALALSFQIKWKWSNLYCPGQGIREIIKFWNLWMQCFHSLRLLQGSETEDTSTPTNLISVGLLYFLMLWLLFQVNTRGHSSCAISDCICIQHKPNSNHFFLHAVSPCGKLACQDKAKR